MVECDSLWPVSSVLTLGFHCYATLLGIYIRLKELRESKREMHKAALVINNGLNECVY